MKRASKIGVGVVLVLVPLLLLALPLPPTKGKWAIHKQDWFLIASIVIAIGSAVLYFVRNRFYPPRSIWPLILLVTSLLIVGNISWNKAFRAYCKAHPEYRREDFRKAMVTTLHWPVYGRYDNAIARYDPVKKRYNFATLPWVLLSCAIAAGWLIWARRRPLDRHWSVGSFAVLIAFQLALILTFAKCEPGLGRLALDTSGYGEFAKDMHRFKGVFDTLRHYVERMPTLEWYGQHYPPGNLILLKIEALVHLPGLTKGLVILLTALTVIPLYELAKELDLSPQAASATILFFAASTSVLILCTINTTSLLLFPAAVCLWMLVQALRTGSIIPAIFLGVFFFGYMMFSFSASILGLLMALITVIGFAQGLFKLVPIGRTAAVAILVVAILIAGLWIQTRFNLVACFVTAVRGHHEQQGNSGFDDLSRYLLRSTGNILAYLISTVPLCVLGIAALRPRQGQNRLAWSAFVALAVTIIIAGFSGLFYLETERIWIFLTPLLAVAAGYECVRRHASEGEDLTLRILLLVLVVSCSQEFLFMHYR